jgi:hypothetical protein
MSWAGSERLKHEVRIAPAGIAGQQLFRYATEDELLSLT